MFFFLKQLLEVRLSYQTAVRKLHPRYESCEIALMSKFSQLQLLITLGLGFVIPGTANHLMGDLAQAISLSLSLHSWCSRERYWADIQYHKQPPAKATFSTRRLDSMLRNLKFWSCHWARRMKMEERTSSCYGMGWTLSPVRASPFLWDSECFSVSLFYDSNRNWTDEMWSFELVLLVAAQWYIQHTYVSWFDCKEEFAEQNDFCTCGMSYLNLSKHVHSGTNSPQTEQFKL